jgi:hypothetical protein
MDESSRNHVIDVVRSTVAHTLQEAQKRGVARAFHELANRQSTEATAKLEEVAARFYPKLLETAESGDHEAVRKEVSGLVEGILDSTGCKTLEEVKERFDGPNTIKLLNKLLELQEATTDDASGELAAALSSIFSSLAEAQQADEADIDEDSVDDPLVERIRDQEARLNRFEREMEMDRRRQATANQETVLEQRREHDRLERGRDELAKRAQKEQKARDFRHKEDEARRLEKQREAAREHQKRSNQFEVVEIGGFGAERISAVTYGNLGNAIHAAKRTSSGASGKTVIVRDKNRNTVWSG